jgi:DNA-binding transcriptional ArsR family regulator
MVESNIQIGVVFTALSDSTRRSILARVAEVEMSVGEVAEYYMLTFAAISKHIKVLEKANLVTKRRRGKEQIVIIVPDTIKIVEKHIHQYAKLWGDRFDNIEELLKEE